MSLRLPEGMEKSSIGKFATFATAIAVVDKNVSLFYYITQTKDMESAKNEETVKKYLKEAKNVPGAAAKNYNANVKQFLEVTKAHSKETAKQYVYKAKGDAERAIEKYKADVKQFRNVTETDAKFAEECLRDAKCDAERAIENYFNHVTEERVKKFRYVTKTNKETATVYLYKAKGDADRAIKKYNTDVKQFCEDTGTNKETAKFYLNKAYGDADRAIENYNVYTFLNVTETNGETAEKTAVKFTDEANGNVFRATKNYLNQIENFFERTGRYDEKLAKFYLNKAYGADEYKNLSVRRCTQEAIKEYKLSKLNKYTRRR